MEKITVGNLSQLDNVAEQLIELFGDHTVVAFYGEMGAGKTTIIRHLCRLLGVTEYVNSPSFAIVNVYKTSRGKAINHFDFYRIKNLAEAYDFGYQEYFYGQDLCLVEWPQIVESLLPANYLKIEIRVISPTEREIIVFN